MVEAGKGTYQGKKESDLIDEKIDEIVLRALGLDDVFDLDYDTYKTLLKERMMADRMGQKMDSGESGAVTDEYKRVKTKVGRFRLNKKKINVGAFKTKTSKPASESIKPKAKMLPGSTFSPIQKSIPLKKEPEVTQQESQKEQAPSTKKEPKVAQQEPQKEKKPFTYNFKKIENILSDIIKNLKETFSFEKNTEKEKNQEEGRKKKKERESTLEKTIGVVAKIGQKILEPLKGPLDYIINWITYTFLGKVFNNILNWASNPDNSKKMMSITRFLKDWWPALVGAYVIFGTSLGGFVSKLIFTVGAFTAKMLVGAIPKLLSLAKSPLGAGALLLGAGAAIPMLMPETVNEQERKTEEKVKKKGKDKVRAELERQANNPNLYERLTGQDAEAKEQLYKIETGETKSYRKGGKVTGQSGTDIRGAGADTQLIAAQPGEIVINKPTVNALGPEFFLALNKKHGGSGANKPKMAKNIQTAAGGGLVLPAFSSGGMIPGGEPDMSNRGRSGNGSLDNIKNFIKQKIGYDVDKPETWGASFSSAFTDKSFGSKPPKSKGKGFDFIATAKGLANQGMDLAKSATDPRSYQGLANQGMGLAKSATDPRSYQGLANQGQGLVNRGGGFKMPNLPSGGGMPGGLNPEKYIPEKYRGDYNRAKETVGGVINKGKEFVGGQVGNARNNAIRDGYLSKRGRYEGAAKAQNNNFLSDMLPNLPGVSNINKAVTESYLTKIGIGRNTKNITKQGENFTKAFYQGKSGIDRGYNVGQLQVNKMSGESKDYYLKKVKEGLSNGTLKSGDTITPYDLSAKDPRRREEGTLRFYVGPDGSPYLMDTYGFDPGKVNLGSEQKKYDEQVAKFRSGKSIMGKIAKSLNLKPLADATEGGEKVQFALALRNKIFGYDPEEEAKKKLGMRFKTKVQVDELRKSMNSDELKQLLQLGKDQLSTNETFLLRNADKKNDAEKLKKEQLKAKSTDQKNQKQLEKNRPFYDPFGTFGGASRGINDRKKEFSSTGFGGKYAIPSTKSLGPVKLYDKPQANTGQPYQSKFASPNQRALDSRNEINRRKETNQKALEAKRPFYDPFGIFGGASAKIQKKQGGGSIEGKSDAPFGTRLIRLLGDLGLPNTGNVMAPRSSGPKDLRGIRQTSAGYENRLFGSRLGTYFPSGLRGEYDEMEKKRYYQRSGKSFRSTLYGTPDPYGYIPYNAEEGMPGLYTPPKSRRQQQQQQKPQTNESLVGNSFRDFGKNVQTIKDASKAREEMMLQMGIKPDGYVNLGGRPIKKKQGGGITENMGMNIAGAAADRQLIAAQPGEYMLTLDTVAKLGGVGAIDRLVARLDSNSNPAKMGKNLKPLPGPPSAAGRSGMMTLPPITGGSGSSGGGGSSGRKQIPNFSATSPYVGERQNKADIYGIK